jgi:hypothetical protein
MHIMELIYTSENIEEWHCPACGRRVSVQWNPFKRTVRDPGDIFAAHRGSKGGLSLSVSPTNNDNVPDGLPLPELPADDPSLTPWSRWANNFDWSRLQNDEDQ